MGSCLPSASGDIDDDGAMVEVEVSDMDTALIDIDMEKLKESLG